MNREQVVACLQEHRQEFQRFGGRSLSLFGSVARGDAGPTSDVDLLVEFERPIGLFDFVRLQQHLETLLGCPVDLVTPDALRPTMREQLLKERIRIWGRVFSPPQNHPK